MSQAIINLSNEELVANAVRTMGWTREVAIDTLIKVFMNERKLDADQILIALKSMGYFG
jgi:hypothetical protein